MSELVARARPYKRWIMLLPLCLGGLWFFVLEAVVPYPRYFMHAKLDDFIPFLPLFVIPYFIWYFFTAVPAIYLFFKDPDEFMRLAVFLTAGMYIACTVYTFWPNGILLRPALANPQGICEHVIKLIYLADTPTNSAPSLHVCQTIGAHVAILRYNARHWKKKWVGPASLITSILIILSTVFVKQHSVIDLVAGLLLGVVLAMLIYGKRSHACPLSQ